MADNYLEKKMEDYRRRGGASQTSGATRRASSLKAGQVAVTFPRRCVFISTATVSPVTSAVVATLRSLGHAVTLNCHTDIASARGLTRAHGATFDPSADTEAAMEADARRRGVAIDARVDILDDGVRLTLSPSDVPVSHTIDTSLPSQTIASAVAFLIHPDAAPLAPLNISGR